ncbi:MAG: hypothetical protein KGJ55_11295 [Gammaproteobacteria bacterium]|nr:hypothetical protein [Gammaproteobacteria bacterium]
MIKLHKLSFGEALATAMALAAAAVSPLAFDYSATGATTLHALGSRAILPALLAWIALAVIASRMSWRRLAAAGRLAIVAGLLGTAVMEVVRATGFRVFHGMPGSLPMLIGVLLTDRFMQGPDWLSNLLGWGVHFWNGIGFAFIYFAVIGRQRWWVGVLYALAIATVFMLGPVMNIIGAGAFGQEFAPIRFPLTVYLAHLVYGVAVGWVGQRSASTPANLFSDALGWPRLPVGAGGRAPTLRS